MTNTTKYILIVLVVLGIVGGTYYVAYQHGKSNVTVKYLMKEKLVHDSTFIVTTKWKHIPGKLDTVFLPDTTYHNQPITIAYSDTLITKDSSTIYVSYMFPPVNQFDVMANIKERITHIVELRDVIKPETFWSRFGASIQTGIGFGWFNKKVDVYTGLGFHYKIF